MGRLERIATHVKEIFTTSHGYFINEHGETVYGKLPRAKVENPLKTICRPTMMSAFIPGLPRPSCVGADGVVESQTTFTSWSGGWPGLWMVSSQRSLPFVGVGY